MLAILPLVSMGVGAARLGISGCGGWTRGPGHVVVPPEQYRGLAAWHPSAASRRVDASAEYSARNGDVRISSRFIAKARA